MTPKDFRALLDKAGLFKSRQDPELRYQIAVLRHSDPVLAKVYASWHREALGLEDLYDELIAREAIDLNLQYAKPVPDQPLNPPGC